MGATDRGSEPDPSPSRTLTVLGCDGSYPGPGGAASGYLVRTGATALWLDAGPGTFAALQRVCDPATLDAVVLTHEHPDHWTDVESLAVWRRLAGVTLPVPVYAPPGLRQRSYFADDPGLEWRTVTPADRIDVGSLTCRFAATDHGPPTVAVRIDPVGAPASDCTQTLAYSADTGADWSAEELGTAIATLLCEATYTAESEGRLRHLSGRQAGAMARSAAVGRLVLTHRWPTVSAEALAAEAGESFGDPVDQAAPGVVIEW